MKNYILSISVALCILIGCNSSQKNSVDTMMSKASRTEKNGWIYVHLEGKPAPPHSSPLTPYIFYFTLNSDDYVPIFFQVCRNDSYHSFS